MRANEERGDKDIYDVLYFTTTMNLFITIITITIVMIEQDQYNDNNCNNSFINLFNTPYECL